MALTATSQATATLTATHRPTGVLAAFEHRPRQALSEVLDVWRAWKASRPAPRPAAPQMVELPRHLLN
jgi:hypothetical protein